MRLPGFYHCKGNPYPTKIKHHNHQSPYFLKEIEEGLGLELKQDEIPVVKPSCNTSKQSKKTVSDTHTSNARFSDGRRNDDLFKITCAMKGRGESYEGIKLELLSLNQNCKPPLTRVEVLEIVDNVWDRY